MNKTSEIEKARKSPRYLQFKKLYANGVSEEQIRQKHGFGQMEIKKFVGLWLFEKPEQNVNNWDDAKKTDINAQEHFIKQHELHIFDKMSKGIKPKASEIAIYSSFCVGHNLMGTIHRGCFDL